MNMHVHVDLLSQSQVKTTQKYRFKHVFLFHVSLRDARTLSYIGRQNINKTSTIHHHHHLHHSDIHESMLTSGQGRVYRFILVVCFPSGMGKFLKVLLILSITLSPIFTVTLVCHDEKNYTIELTSQVHIHSYYSSLHVHNK